MIRAAAMASAALRRLVLASSRPSILSRAVSAGRVLSRRQDLSVYHHPVLRPFPVAFDLSRGYAGGRRERNPYDEDESNGLDDDECFGSDDEEIQDDFDGLDDGHLDEDDFSNDSAEESD